MRKFTLPLIALAAALALLPVFSAFEAHVVNVTARIENALSVTPLSIDYGTVFPQEKLDKTFDVQLSQSFLDEADSVGTQYASSVGNFSQGVRVNNTAVLADRSDPTDALGAPQSTGAFYDNPVVAGSFVALGFNLANPTGPGGSIVLGFDDYIVDVPGNDITIYEITGGTAYPDEKVKVEASQDGTTWFVLATSLARDGGVNLGVLPWAKYVRLTEVSTVAFFEQTGDGYDLDAVKATSQKSLGAINYIIRQKPKCGLPIPETDPVQYSAFGQATEDEEGNFICQDEGYVTLPLLCPYLSKHELTTDGPELEENDSAGINAFHGLPGIWNLATTIATQVEGALAKLEQDTADEWNIDLRVPCFGGYCAQDWADFVHSQSGNPEIDAADYVQPIEMQHELYGCDLWVEVTDIF